MSKVIRDCLEFLPFVRFNLFLINSLQSVNIINEFLSVLCSRQRSGVEFPQRSFDSAPIFTPPMTHPTPRAPQPGYGMPSNSSTRLDEVMAAEIESLRYLQLKCLYTI